MSMIFRAHFNWVLSPMAKVKYPLQPFKEPMSLKRGKTQVDGLRLASAKYLIGLRGAGG